MSKHHRVAQAKTCHATSFAYSAPEARNVFLAGTFNDWDPHSTPMEHQSDGIWRVVLELVPGRYEYKFVVDGVWCCDSANEDTGPPQCCVPNPFGTMNSVIEVSGNAQAGETATTAA